MMNLKEFWQPLYEATGGGLQPFYDWVDKYKDQIGWGTFFKDGIQFYDLPMEIQVGILDYYLCTEKGYGMDRDHERPKEMLESIKEDLMEEFQRWCPGDCIYDSLLKVGEEKCPKCIKLDKIHEQIWALEDEIEKRREQGADEKEIDALWCKVHELDAEAEKI